MPKNKKRVLLVEDEGSLVNILRENLIEEGFDVLVAIQGEEALQKITDEHPDLVLLDIILPRLDGFVFLKRVKNDPELKSIPIIVLSNLGQDGDVAKGKELGASDYLVKANHPISSVIATVKKFI
ncbi:MAG: response regulator [Patescibacteria group bacterium]